MHPETKLHIEAATKFKEGRAELESLMDDLRSRRFELRQFGRLIDEDIKRIRKALHILQDMQLKLDSILFMGNTLQDMKNVTQIWLGPGDVFYCKKGEA
jgi:hypothetical protein